MGVPTSTTDPPPRRRRPSLGGDASDRVRIHPELELLEDLGVQVRTARVVVFRRASSPELQLVADPQSPPLEGAGLGLDHRPAPPAGNGSSARVGRVVTPTTTISLSQKATSMGNRMPKVCTDRVRGSTSAPS